MEKVKKYVPISALVMVVLLIISVTVNIISIYSTVFSDFFNLKVAPFFRFILAKVTGILPFSLAEILIILLPIIVGLLLFLTVRISRQDGIKKIRFVLTLISVIAYIYVSFVFTFSTAYRVTRLEDNLGLERGNISKEQLKSVSELLVNELTPLTEQITYGEDKFSEMPYSFKELNELLNDAYARLTEKYDFVSKLRSNVKKVMLSEPMTYTHISGVYTFFTGEANVNVNFPDYTLPFTMAHEMAHQRGIAREDEANFVAFLVCLESSDSYIRYSAYLNMYEYIANSLYRADKDMYKEVYMTLPDTIRAELIAYSEFFDKYRDNVASDISDKVNDSYLVSQGQTSGTRSYGLVTELAVAYLLN